jgi:periplasmic protein CpxP/Spy
MSTDREPLRFVTALTSHRDKKGEIIMVKRSMALIIATTALTLTGAGGSAFAHCGEEGDGPGHGKPGSHRAMEKMDAEHRLERMSRHLNLSEAQKARIKPLLAEEEQQMKALREQFRSIRKATMDKIKPVLTPEQLKTYENTRDKMKQRWEGKRRCRDCDMKP